MSWRSSAEISLLWPNNLGLLGCKIKVRLAGSLPEHLEGERVARGDMQHRRLCLPLNQHLNSFPCLPQQLSGG